MLEIIEARSRRELKTFFSVSEACGYSREEARYLEEYASPALNPVRTDKRAYLYAVKDGKTVGRLLTWRDEVYVKATGENCGFFALCDATDCECTLLIDEMIRLQRQWGSSCVRGPVAPDGSGFFWGICKGGDKGIFNSPPGLIDLPEMCGFRMCDEMRSFAVLLPDVDKLGKLAEASKARFGLSSKRLEKRLFGDPLIECVYELSSSREYARQAERIAPSVDRRYSFGVYSGRHCCGYLIVLKGEVPRIATLMTGNGAFSAASAGVLLAEAAKAFRNDGVSEAEAGVIDPANSGSMLLARYASGRQINRYLIYYNEIK